MRAGEPPSTDRSLCRLLKLPCPSHTDPLNQVHMLHLGLLATAALLTSASTERVGIVGLGENQREATATLAQALASDGRGTTVLVLPLGPKSSATADHLQHVEKRLKAAQTAYQEFDLEQARAALLGIDAALADNLHRDDARLWLGRLHRLQARMALLEKDAATARRQFRLAARIDPRFAPSVDLWPPDARLAYADAVAENRSASIGILSLTVRPSRARVWVNGVPRDRGSQTLRDLRSGEHRITVRAPGHTPLAVTIETPGGNQLKQASLFMRRQSDAKLGGQLAAGLLETPHHSDGLAQLLLERLAVTRLVVLASEGARLFGADGSAHGPALIGPPVSEAIVARLHQQDSSGGRPTARSPAMLRPAGPGPQALQGTASPAAAALPPWYARPESWVMGGLLVGGILSAILLLTPDNKPPRATLMLGVDR